MRPGRLAVVLVALAVGGCGGGDDRAPASVGAGLTGDEVEWVAAYATWVDGFGDLLAVEAAARAAVLGDEAGFERYRRATSDLRACREGLDEALGDVPSVRLGATLDALRAMCEQVESAVGRLADATDPSSRTGPFLDASQAADRAHLDWTGIGADLDELTLARGMLPRVGGETSRSRIEPVLSAAAVRAADGRAVEVRCWSRADWDRVLEEEGALTRGAMNVDTVGAFALPLTGTLHLQQEQCEPLVRLRSGRTGPLAGDTLHVVAAALGVLSHEVQHVVAPSANEAATECAALQHTAELAIELGVSPGDAERLAGYYWQVVYPAQGEAYRSADCVPGGALDLAPQTTAWPTG